MEVKKPTIKSIPYEDFKDNEYLENMVKQLNEGGDGFMDMSDEEILAKGINDSLIHVDFMVGSDDLHIVGIHEDGSETDVFVNGTWAE